ncbi:MAG TPA: porin [Thermoanaerobaculia bacterium]
MKKIVALALFLALPAVADETAAKPSITFSGLAQIHARGFTGQSGPVAETPDSFLLRRAEIRITGTINPRISGYISVDPAKQLNMGANGVSQSSNVLQEVVISYQVSPKTYVDVGQFKIPVGYEGDLVSSSALQNVERALLYQARDPQGGGQGDIRDTGIRVRTVAGPFELHLGAFNGLGERQNTTAVGDEKALVARALYNVKGVEGLRVGLSGGHASERSIGTAFAVYKQGRATLQTEYAAGDHRYEPRGYYAHFGWALTPKIETTARYDVFDFDRNSVGDTVVRDVIVGANYLLRGNNAKIQANLIHRDGGVNLVGGTFPSSAATFANSGTQLRVNFQVGF